MAHSLGEAYGHVLFVEAEAGSQHERYFILSDQGVDDVEEARDTVRVVQPNRDESGVHIRRKADCVLDVQGLSTCWSAP